MDRRTKLVLKGRHVTEKAAVLQDLVNAESNPSVRRCNQAKYVFLVDVKSNKHEIKKAVEEAFSSQKIHVDKVNTITLPRKKKRVRSSRRFGTTALKKKAVVTLREGETIDFEIED